MRKTTLLMACLTVVPIVVTLGCGLTPNMSPGNAAGVQNTFQDKIDAKTGSTGRDVNIGPFSGGAPFVAAVAVSAITGLVAILKLVLVRRQGEKDKVVRDEVISALVDAIQYGKVASTGADEPKRVMKGVTSKVDALLSGKRARGVLDSVLDIKGYRNGTR